MKRALDHGKSIHGKACFRLGSFTIAKASSRWGTKKKMTSSALAAEKHISEIKDALTNANVFFLGVRAF
jgi:hypothetical protein